MPRRIELGFNNISEEGIKTIVNALESGNCPAGLNINLANNNISEDGGKAIAKALKSGNCPAGLNISLYFNDIGKELLYEIQFLERNNNNYHELKALNRIVSLFSFFMSIQSLKDTLPQELKYLIGLQCLQSYDLTIFNKLKHECKTLGLREIKAAAVSRLAEFPNPCELVIQDENCNSWFDTESFSEYNLNANQNDNTNISNKRPFEFYEEEQNAYVKKMRLDEIVPMQNQQDNQTFYDNQCATNIVNIKNISQNIQNPIHFSNIENYPNNLDIYNPRFFQNQISSGRIVQTEQQTTIDRATSCKLQFPTTK